MLIYLPQEKDILIIVHTGMVNTGQMTDSGNYMYI